MATALAQGRTTSAHLVQQALHREVDGAIERRLDEAPVAAGQSDARRRAGAKQSPWDGLPFAVKANIDVAGVPTTAGTAVGAPSARRDAPVVAMLRRAGMIPVLTTTLAEGALGAVTDNPHTGLCPSPRYPHLNAGGSSGGSAAVVAAGAVPLALGSDTMGSVRLPAAYCGVAAYKPTRTAISTAGLVPLHRLLDTVGLLASSAGDLQALLPLVFSGEPPPSSSGAPTIGIPAFVEAADTAGREATASAAAVLERHGHHVVRNVPMPFAADLVRRRGLLLCEVGGYRAHQEAVDAGDPGISDALRSLLRYGRDAAADRVATAHAELTALSRTIRHLMGAVDVMLLPASPGSPPLLGDDPPHAADFTAWVNVAGLPAVAFPGVPARVPQGAEDAPPRGLQVVGRAGDDLRTVAVAALVERALTESR